MCRRLLTENKQPHLEDTGFMTGLLSNIGTLMGQPIQKVLSNLPLADEVCDALLKGEGAAGEALTCTLAYEQNDWENVQFKNFDKKQIRDIYLNASDVAFKEHEALFG